jgi:hypothetical protein
LIGLEESTGVLREEYDAALERAGKVFNIVKAMSLRPDVLRASMNLYREIMFGESALPRTRVRSEPQKSRRSAATAGATQRFTTRSR